MKTQASLAAVAALTSVASALDSLSIDGSDFINNSTGDRFDIIGITYDKQPPPQPPGRKEYPLGHMPTCLHESAACKDIVKVERD